MLGAAPLSVLPLSVAPSAAAPVAPPVLNDLDMSQDWALIDDLETVALIRKTGRTAYAAEVEVPNVLRRASTKIVLEGGVRFRQTTTSFHLWAEFADPAPKPGDVIMTASGERWSIDEVDVFDHGQRYRCPVTKE